MGIATSDDIKQMGSACHFRQVRLGLIPVAHAMAEAADEVTAKFETSFVHFEENTTTRGLRDNRDMR